MSDGDGHRASDGLSALVDALTGEADSLLAVIRSRLEERFPTYAALPADLLDTHLRLSLEHTLASVRAAGPGTPDDADVAAMADVGEAEAEAGIPIDDLLGVWRIGLQHVSARARELATDLGLAESVALDFMEATLAWSDVAMAATARAHRRAELELSRRDQERRAGFALGVLQGTLGPAAIRTLAAAYGIEPGREYVAIRARPADDAARWQLERALGFHTAAPHRPGLSTPVEGDVAGFLREPPAPVDSGVVGVGPRRPIERLSESFRLASRALTTAIGFGLTGVFDLGSLGIRPAIVADHDVAAALHERYLAPVLATGSGAEVLTTVRTYFEHGMHVERAADAPHIHQNTLRYRVGRFEELTDVSLRDTTVALEVWWALQAEGATVTGADDRRTPGDPDRRRDPPQARS
jgi:hypothetical protein